MPHNMALRVMRDLDSVTDKVTLTVQIKRSNN